MRRNAFHLVIPCACALLAVMLIGGTRGSVQTSSSTVRSKPSATHRGGKTAVSAAPLAQPTPFLATVASFDLKPEPPEPKPLDQFVAAAKAGTPQVVIMEVTAYCPCRKCCGPEAAGITASGRRVSYNGGHFVAADSDVPFHTRLEIPGYFGGKPVPVLDRGGAIKNKRLDVFFPTHEQALKWGRRKVAVTILP
jgi:3D (Asp-Asp-Asp) domain-containing protein